MDMKENVTISVSQKILEVIKAYYKPYFVTASGEYVDFQANINGIVVTGYSSRKENKKVTFQGENALREAQIWNPEAKVNEKKEIVSEGWLCFEDQIGSDEVGVGDFLGPMIVVAAYVNKKDIKKLQAYGIHDSKKMTDIRIMEIGPKIVKEFKFSKLTLQNEKYNEVLDKGENLNSMKAKMHNRALLNMHKEHPEVTNIFVDEFVNEKKYYKYLNDEKEEQVTGIVFKTKGESYFPCVALASVIARYSYLREMEKLGDKYKMAFPFGAGKKVNAFATKFVKKYGEKEFYKIVKKNFANYSEVLNNKLI